MATNWRGGVSETMWYRVKTGVHLGCLLDFSLWKWVDGGTIHQQNKYTRRLCKKGMKSYLYPVRGSPWTVWGQWSEKLLDLRMRSVGVWMDTAFQGRNSSCGLGWSPALGWALLEKGSCIRWSETLGPRFQTEWVKKATDCLPIALKK